MRTDEHQRHQKNLLDIPDPRRRAQELSRLVVEQQALLTDLARLRRDTIAELRTAGLTQAQVAEVLGVSPGRISQLEPSPGTSPKDTHVVERAIPTEPGIRASRSLYLSETEHQ